MAAQAGRLVLIEIETATPGTFSVLGGLRSKTISLSEDQVDSTDSESTGQWRELLSGAATKSASISGDGIFKDTASEALLQSHFFAGTFPKLRFTVPAFGAFAGNWQISNLEYAGEYEGEATYTVSFESAGAIAFTAA